MWVSIMQRSLKENNKDDLAGDNSVIQDRSGANQRIEAYWSELRKGGGG